MRRIRLDVVNRYLEAGLPKVGLQDSGLKLDQIGNLATEAAERLTDLGAQAIDLHRIAQAAAYYAVMSMIGIIDDGD